MSEPRILLLGPALDAVDSARSLEMLGSVTLPNTTRYVVTTGKFNAGKLAKTFNVETGYPPDPAALQTFAAWAEVSHRSDFRFRDGYDLYCLRSLLATNDMFDYAVLLRDAAGFQELWPELLTKIEDKLFLTFPPQPANARASDNVLFNLRDERMAGLLGLAWDLYASGAVYALPAYCLESALATAVEAMKVTDDMLVQFSRVAAAVSPSLC